MPRKAKPLALKIEGLSGGEAHTAQSQPTVFIDDFTGEAVPVAGVSAHSPEVAAPAPDHRLIARDSAQRERAEQLSMLVRLGLSDRPDPIPRPLVERVPKGYRKIGEIAGKAVLFPLAKWRRM